MLNPREGLEIEDVTNIFELVFVFLILDGLWTSDCLDSFNGFLSIR
jgi:hypothetical protein